MPYTLFHSYFPAIAEKETRTITILPGSRDGLPPGDYSFLEMFCDERGCDCRRVFFTVVSSFRKGIEAVVAWGWEEPDFYAKWMKDDDPDVVATLKGPALNMGSPETELAPAILDLVSNVLLQDSSYVERVKRHYGMFREKVEGRGALGSGKKKRRKRRRHK